MMFKGGPQATIKALHCMSDVIGFFSIMEMKFWWSGIGQNLNQFRAIIVSGSHGNGRLVNMRIVLLEQHTFNEIFRGTGV